MIDPRLITLLTLIEEKSYTNTAARLSFTQPAITHHIKAIEKEFEIELFKNPKTFELSRAGKILVDYAKESKVRYDQLLNNFKKASSEIVRLGVTEMSSQALANSDFMKKLNELVPKFNIYTYNADIIEEKILHGELDLGVIDTSFDSQSFESQYLFSNRIVPVCKADGQYVKGRLTRELLLSAVIIIGNKDSGIYKTTIGTLHSKNIRLNHNIILESNNPGILCDLVCINDAIGFMYEDSAKLYESMGKIKIVELWNFKPIQNSYLIYNRLAVLDDNVNNLLDSLKGDDL